MIDFDPNWADILNADLAFAPLDENNGDLKLAMNDALHDLHGDERTIGKNVGEAIIATAYPILENLHDVLADRDNDNSFHRKWLAKFLKKSHAVLLVGEHADAVQWCHDNAEGDWDLLEWLGYRIIVFYETSDVTHFKLRWTE